MTTSEARRYQNLRAHLGYLKLNDAAEHLNTVLDAARSERLSLTAALERLPEIEVDATEARRLAGRLRFVCLPAPWTITDFDFAAQPGVDEKLVRDLATLRFLDDAANVLFVGPLEVGKTTLAVALARGAAEARGEGLLHHRRRPRRPLPQVRPRRPLEHRHALLRRTEAADHRRTRLPSAARRWGLGAVPGHQPALSQGEHDRDHQRRHRRLGRRGAFGDATVAATMLDRLLHRAAVVGIDGPS